MIHDFEKKTEHVSLQEKAEKKEKWVNFSLYSSHSVEKREICSQQKILSNQLFGTYLEKTLFSRIFCEKNLKVNLRHFHTV